MQFLSLSILALVCLGLSETTSAHRRSPAFTPSHRSTFYANIAYRQLSLSDNDIGEREDLGPEVVVVRPKREDVMKRRAQCVPNVPVVSASISASPTSPTTVAGDTGAQQTEQTSSGMRARFFESDWWFSVPLAVCALVIVT